MKRILKFALVALLAIATFTGCSTKKVGGGTLVVYSPNSDSEITNILEFFGTKYNIDIQLQSMGTGEVVSKLTAEKANPQADVMFGGMNQGTWMNNKDLFQAYTSKNDKKLPEGYRNKTGFYTNYLLSGSNLLVNTDLEKALGITIKGYADLLNPLLKGKIASADPTSSSSAWAQLTNILLVEGGYDNAKAWDYVKALMVNLNGKLTSGSSAVYKGVSAGEYVVGLTYEDPSVSLLQSGAKNLRVVYPSEGAVWLPAASAIVTGAKNLENAKLFMDFLDSDECQKIIGGLTNRPANTSIPNTNAYLQPFSAIKIAYEDVSYTAINKKTMQAKWSTLWAEVNKK